MISAVPGQAQPPTSPNRPSRTRQASSISSRVAGEAHGQDQLDGRRGRARRRPRRRRARPSSAPPNSTSSAADSGGSSRQCSGLPSMFHAAAISAGATISSVARAPAATSAGTAAAASSMFAKCTHASVVRAGSGRVRSTASATNASVPSRADDEPAEDLERRLGVEQRAQPVAGDVLDLVLAPDALGELLVGEQLVAQLQQPLRELGLGGGEALLGVGRGGVDHGAGGEHERQRLDGRVGVPRARRSACRRSCWRSRRRSSRSLCSPGRGRACGRDARARCWRVRAACRARAARARRRPRPARARTSAGARRS